RRLRRAMRKSTKTVEDAGETTALPSRVAYGDALVAEIPKASTRWNQANFDKASYEGFFGVPVSTGGRIVLRHVSATGGLGPAEPRPGVAVKSHNYRFELAAASGLAYPARGRPIGVFVRTSAGMILYSLLMPGDVNHAVVASFLKDRWLGSASRV